MSRNARTSSHYSTPQAARHRPKVGLTLSPEAIERLGTLVASTGRTKSAIVDALILSENTDENSVKKLFSTIDK